MRLRDRPRACRRRSRSPRTLRARLVEGAGTRGVLIPAQRKLLTEYAAQHGLDIINEFENIETAKRAGRTGFSEMVRFLQEKPAPRPVLLVEKTDRLYRNIRDWVTSKVDGAYEDRLGSRISDGLWQRKSAGWEAELAAIRRETARHERASHDYGATGSKILELAKNAHNLFVSRDSHEQARLLKMLVSNCAFDRGSLLVAYVKPFDLLVEGNKTGNWLADWDSNSEAILVWTSSMIKVAGL